MRHAYEVRLREHIKDQARRYISTQSWAEISARMSAADALFSGYTLVDVLKGWQLPYSERTIVANQWVAVKNTAVALALRAKEVPWKQYADGTVLFRRSSQTVKAWHQVLCDVIQRLLVSQPQTFADAFYALQFFLTTPTALAHFNFNSFRDYVSSFGEPLHDRHMSFRDRTFCATISMSSPHLFFHIPHETVR